MRIYLQTLSFIFFSISLSACDGLDLDSVNSTSSEDSEFTASELAFNVVYSSLLLADNSFIDTSDGFIVLFNSSSDLDQIKLRDNNNEDDVLVGNYAWTIDDDELLVTYPDGVTCTSTKTSDTTLEYTASADCDGDDPDNDSIEGTLNVPNSFDSEDLESQSITIENDDDDDDSQTIDFFSNGTFEVTDLDSDGDDISGTTEVGVYAESNDLSDVVRLDNTTTGEYSLLILLDGSLSIGTLLELRYSDQATNTLEEVRIYSIDSISEWNVESLYDDISTDS